MTRKIGRVGRGAWLATFACTVACSPGGEEASAVEGERVAPKKTPKARATRVEVARLEASDATLELVIPGEIEGSRDAHLASATGGFVEGVFVDVGDPVKAGQALAWIDRAAMLVKLDQAMIRRDEAKNDLAIVERAGSSVARSRRDSAKFAARSAEAAFRLADLDAKRAVIRSAFDGVVAERLIEPGEVVPIGGPTFRVVSTNPVHATLSASDSDVSTLAVGDDAVVTTVSNRNLYPGKIKRISPAANLETRTFMVEVEVDNEKGELRPGMISMVQFSKSLEKSAVSIPQYVLVTKRTGNGVFVLRGGQAEWRPVELGRVVRGQVLIRSGLSVGDVAVVTGHRELADGDPLIVAREGVCCTDGRIEFPKKTGELKAQNTK